MQIAARRHRELFEQELLRRIEKNPRYSMRAFAKSLSVSHSALSLVMSGKRPVSTNLLEKLADGMGLSPIEKTKLVQELETSRMEHPVYSTIDLDVFEVISDWYHFAILSLLELPNAKFDPKWVGGRLTISEIQAKLAMERLIRLGLVAEIDGEFKQTGKPLKFENTVSTAATRKYNLQLLARAQDSLMQDPIEHRDMSSMTFVMDESLVPYAKQKIRAFRRKLVAELEGKSTPNRVYNLTVQLFPGSTTTKNSKKRDQLS